MRSRHRLLSRQIRKHLASGVPETEAFMKFLDAVNAAYAAFDADRAMLERSLELSSQELMQACAEQKKASDALHQAHHDLEARVRDRTAELVAANARMMREMTERKRAEAEARALQEQLFQAQKMEAVGQLAGGLAHDFNNLLSGIICNCYLLQKQASEESPLRVFVDEIRTAAQNGAQLITSLLAFSKKQPLVTHAVNINQVLLDAHNLLSRVLGEDIVFEVSVSNEALIIVADSVRIEQVLMNLATNARDAMPRGGSLKISIRRAEIDEAFIRLHGFGKCGAYALLEVADTGCGMDAETRARIFEPFFTTKEPGKGTGLGLAMVYGTVKQHRGYILAQSDLLIGTTFSLYFPLITVPAKVKLSSRASREPAGCETLLLAEDEPAVRASMKAVLESFGYRVIEAVDGDDAIAKLVGHGKGVHLLITDIVMPRKNGWHVFQEANRIMPGIRTLFTSGYLDNLDCAREIAENGFQIMTKPVDPAELNNKIREELDGRSAENSRMR